MNLFDLKQFLNNYLIRKLQTPKTVVLLYGEMGAGKTQCVKYMVELLGGAGVSSPTFSIIQEYETKIGTAFHVDLYRIKNEADLDSTGFWELFKKKSGIVFIEWPEKLPHKLFGDWQRIEIQLSFFENDNAYMENDSSYMENESERILTLNFYSK